MTLVAASPAAVRRFGLLLGIVLVLPQLVVAVLVGVPPLVVGLAGFAFTIGVVRLATVGYRVLEERPPFTRRVARFAVGAVALVTGALLYPVVARAVAAAADTTHRGVLAPPDAIALNLVVLATLALWITGAAFAAGAVIGRFVRR